VRPGFQKIEIGKGEVVRHGSDVAFLAIGNMVHQASLAADILAAEGIDAEVVNMRFIKPIDEDLLRSVGERFKNILTIEENVTDGGFGSAVLEGFARLGFTGLNTKLHGLPSEFVDHGSPAELLRLVKLDGPGIADVAREFLAKVQHKHDVGLAHS
jgi:1-deoxy-D-xylulose-5-phosphate synthase